MMTTDTIEVWGQLYEVDYTYWPARSKLNAPPECCYDEPEDCEVHGLRYQGKDVSFLLEGEAYEEFENAVIRECRK